MTITFGKTMNQKAFSLSALFLSSLLTLSAPAALAQKATKTAVNPPPSADLGYTIQAVQHGLTLNGTANVQWRAGDGRYSIASETRASLLGKILEAKSEGAIDANGLAPQTAVEKRFRKGATTTTFDRAANTIRFDASDETFPIKGGEQDRNSVVWQLATIARSTPARFKTGSTISTVVASQKNASVWRFKVGKSETLQTGLGSMKATKVSKVIGDDDKDQKIEIWFAPGKDWYPVRVRFTEPEGDTIEQTISSIAPR